MNPELSRDLHSFVEDASAGSDDYVVEELLKESETECTELVRDTHGKRWVRKLFLRDDPSIERSYRAIEKAGSPYLPRIRDAHRSAAGIMVVREYFPGPTLRQWVDEYGALDESQARSALLEICQSVRELHSLEPPLIHRDINPSNIIVTIEGPKLIDFGIARAYDEKASRDTHAWGTTGYAAPEQFGFDQSDERTDVFALGMLYWFMLTGEDPEANLSARLRQDAKDGALPMADTRACEIIQNCVALAPEARYDNVEVLMSALQDEKLDVGAKAAPETRSSTSRAFRRTLSRTWLVISTCFMAIVALGVITTLASPWRLSVSEGWLHALVFCLGLVVMFAPTWLLSTNLFGIRDRVPFLRRHTLVRCIVIAFVCFIAGALIANAATENLPAAYLQLMQQNGATSI